MNGSTKATGVADSVVSLPLMTATTDARWMTLAPATTTEERMTTLKPAEVERLLKRARRHAEKSSEFSALSTKEITDRTRIVALLRDGGVPMLHIADELGLSRQILNKQLGEFRCDPHQYARDKTFVGTCECGLVEYELGGPAIPVAGNDVT